MKKTILAIAFCISAGALAQKFFVTEFDEDDGWMTGTKLDDAFKPYTSSGADVLNLFSNDAFRVLLGDKDLLEKKMNPFSLAQLSNQHLRLLRNMIFARYGYKFSSADLNTYFGKFGWYKPTASNVDSKFTATDKHNIQLIQAFERRNEKQPDTRWSNDKTGLWQYGMAYAASVYDSRFIIRSTNKLDYYFPEYEEFQTVQGLGGAYTIKGNVLIWNVTEIYFHTDCFDIDLDINYGYHFVNPTQNTIRLEKPIVYKFPVSAIKTEVSEGREIKIITIGTEDYYKLGDGSEY